MEDRVVNESEAPSRTESMQQQQQQNQSTTETWEGVNSVYEVVSEREAGIDIDRCRDGVGCKRCRKSRLVVVPVRR